MKRFLTAVLTATAIALVAPACDELEDPNEPNAPKVLELTTKQEAYVASGNDFAFRFLKEIQADAKKDYVISPLSMQFLLGMVLNGAKGETATEISKVLGYGAGETQLVNEYCLTMLSNLPKLDKKTTVSIADAIFVDKGFDLLPEYKIAVAKHYLAEVSNLDFKDTKGSAAHINKWCSDNTQGLIPKILDEVSPDMLAYLLNALYFKGEWTTAFNKASTSEEKFRLPNDTGVKLPMMKLSHELEYTENDFFQAVTLPYGNRAFSMTVLLPKGKSTIDDAAAYFCKNSWNDFRWSMMTCKVDLWLPRFETSFEIELNDILSAMGMPTSFKYTADFSAMSPDALCLSFVKQNAAIKVDEEGSEAAAVSSAGMMKTTSIGGDAPPAIFHADHPFLYLITESSTGAILFTGRYSGPAEEPASK